MMTRRKNNTIKWDDIDLGANKNKHRKEWTPPEVIRDIVSSLSIVELISDVVKLTPSTNGEMVGLCPFHKEKQPSFFVNENKKTYYCYGCNAGGGYISFLMEYFNMTYPDAVNKIKASVGLGDLSDSDWDKYKINVTIKKISNKINNDNNNGSILSAENIMDILSRVGGNKIDEDLNNFDEVYSIYEKFFAALWSHDNNKLKLLFNNLDEDIKNIESQ